MQQLVINPNPKLSELNSALRTILLSVNIYYVYYKLKTLILRVVWKIFTKRCAWRIDISKILCKRQLKPNNE